MADKNANFNKITSAVDDEAISKAYKNGKVSSRFASQEDLKKVVDIKKRLQEMAIYRQQSCPWYIFPSSSKSSVKDETTGEISEQYGSATTGNGSFDWGRRWERDFDLWSMKSGKNTLDPDLHEVTSPITFSPVQAALAQFQDANTTATFDCVAGTDKIYSRVATAWALNWEDKVNAQQTIKNPTFLDVLIYGTAITYNSRINKTRTVKKIKTIEEILEGKGYDEKDPSLTQQEVDKAREAVIKKIKANPLKEMTVEETITDFDDLWFERVPIKEFFVDPNALEINGVAREARDCIWLKNLTVQQVLQDYLDCEDPFVIQKNIDIDLIKSAGDVSTYYKEIDISNDMENALTYSAQSTSEMVSLIHYYNKYTDQYIILANDIIIREGPLPYNHKQLPFSKYVCFPLANQFYGAGYPVLLDNIQSRDELYQSLQDFTAQYNANLPGVYTVSGENSDLENSMAEVMGSDKVLKAGQWIRVGQNESATRMQPINLGMEIDRIRQNLVENSIKITGVNPIMSSLPTQNTAVRNNQQIQENSLLLIRMIINNWGKGYEEAITQGLHIVKQTEPYSYELIEDKTEKAFTNQEVEAKVKQYKQIETKGFSITKNDYGEMVNEENPKGGTIELNPSYTDYFDKLKVKVRIETSALASKQLQGKQLQDNLTLTMNVLGNPAFANNPIIIDLLKNVLDKQNAPAEILNKFNDDNSDDSDFLADVQNANMMEGRPEASMAGMSINHQHKHSVLLMDLMTEREMLTMQPPEIDPMTGEPIPNGQVGSLTEKVKLLIQHMKGDIQSKSDESLASIKMADSFLQPPMPQPPQGQMPDMQGQQPMPSDMPMNPIPQI